MGTHSTFDYLNFGESHRWKKSSYVVPVAIQLTSLVIAYDPLLNIG